jgi:hypothetical protein
MKTKWMMGAAAVAVLWPGAPLWAAAWGFERYQVILERKLFGEPPPVLVAPGPAPVEEPPWAKSYRLCSVYQEEGEPVEVALLDLKTNKPVMLTLDGGPNQGIELLFADIETEEARLIKDGLEVTMSLEASKAPPPKPKQPSKPGRRKPKPRPKPAGAAVNQPNNAAPANTVKPPQPARGVMRARR